MQTPRRITSRASDRPPSRVSRRSRPAGPPSPSSGRPVGRAAAAAWLVFALLVAAGPATAAMRDWVVRGTVTSRTGPVYDAGCLPGATVGAPFRLDLTFDDSMPDAIASPAWGAYASVYDWRLQLPAGGDEVAGNTGGVDVFDDYPVASDLVDKVEVTFLNVQSWPAPCQAAVVDLVLTLLEQSPTAPTATTSDAQPATPPPVQDFTTAHRLVLDADGSVLEMTVERVDVLGAVPVPLLGIGGAIGLVGLLGGLGHRAARRCGRSGPRGSGA